jgi:hypothetical protein
MRLLSKDKRRRKARIKRFCREVLRSAKAGLEICGVVEDREGGSGQDRVVILTHATTDRPALEALVRAYFGEFCYKIVVVEERPRPTSGLQTGAGIHRSDSQAFGTLAGVFKRAAEGADSPHLYGLCNMHVLGPCMPGTATAILDLAGAVVGHLFECVPLLPGEASPNLLDAAIFRFSADVQPRWQRYPQGRRRPDTGLAVQQLGARSGLRRGVVRGAMQVFVSINGQTYWFQDAIAIEGQGGPFSADGDSGAMVMTEDARMVGVLFSASGTYGYAFDAKHLRVLGLLY